MRQPRDRPICRSVLAARFLEKRVAHLRLRAQSLAWFTLTVNRKPLANNRLKIFSALAPSAASSSTTDTLAQKTASCGLFSTLLSEGLAWGP